MRGRQSAKSGMPMSEQSGPIRRSHYENAFEDYLKAHRIAFVAVADAKRSVPGRLGVKAFDYIVYAPEAPPYLVDVKGRKFPKRANSPRRRWDSWVTQGDVDGLLQWQTVFGSEFTSAFVFAYWLPELTPQERAAPENHVFAGRAYGFWGIHLPDYRQYCKVRSGRWKTVDLPVEQFIRMAWPLSRWLPGAPAQDR